MIQDDEDGTAIYVPVVCDEQQYPVWPVNREILPGGSRTGGPAAEGAGDGGPLSARTVL